MTKTVCDWFQTKRLLVATALALGQKVLCLVVVAIENRRSPLQPANAVLVVDEKKKKKTLLHAKEKHPFNLILLEASRQTGTCCSKPDIWSINQYNQPVRGLSNRLMPY